MTEMLICSRCSDRFNPTDHAAEGKAVRRGEDLKAEEEMFHGKQGGARAAVGGTQGEGQA